MNIPVTLNGPQASLLNAVLVAGGEDLFVLDQPVNGGDLLLVVARGAARDYAKAQLFTGKAEAPAPEVTPEPEVTPDLAPPVRVVGIESGVIAAKPPGM